MEGVVSFCRCLSTMEDLTLEGLAGTRGERWLGLAGRAGRPTPELELLVLLGSFGRAGEELGLLWGEEEKPLLLELVGFGPGLVTGFSTELDREGDLE